MSNTPNTPKLPEKFGHGEITLSNLDIVYLSNLKTEERRLQSKLDDLESKNIDSDPQMEELIDELYGLLAQKRKLINQITSENPLQKDQSNNDFLKFIQSLKDIDILSLAGSKDDTDLFVESERNERSELKSKFKNVFLINQYLTVNVDNLESQLSLEEIENFVELKQNLDKISKIFKEAFENRNYSNLHSIGTELEIFKNWEKYFENGKPQNPKESWQNYLLSGILPNSKIILDKLFDKNQLDDKTQAPLQIAIKKTEENIKNLNTKITIAQLKLDKSEKFENVTRVELWIKSVEESIDILNQVLLESQKGQLEEQFRQQSIENLNRLFNTEIPQTEENDKQGIQTQTSNISPNSALVKTYQIVHQSKNETQIENRDYSEGIRSYPELKKLLNYFSQNYPNGSEDVKIRSPETGGLIAKIKLSGNSNEFEINYENSKKKVLIESSISFPPLINLPKEFPTKEKWSEILKDLDGQYLNKYNYSQYPRFFHKIGKDEDGYDTYKNLLNDFMEFLKFTYEKSNQQAYQDFLQLINQINSLLVNDNSIFFQETIENKKPKSKNEKTHQIIVQYYSSPNIQKVVDLIEQFNQKSYTFQIGNSFKKISYYDADENDNYSPTEIIKLENISDIIANFNIWLKKIFPDKRQRENIVKNCS